MAKKLTGPELAQIGRMHRLYSEGKTWEEIRQIVLRPNDVEFDKYKQIVLEAEKQRKNAT